MAMNATRQRNILLISNSTMHGTGYLDHAEAAIRELLRDRREILFVPFALHDRQAYNERARERFARMGYRVHAATEAAARSLHQLDQMDAIFVGGGNTFRLLKTLYDYGLLEPIRRFAAASKPYIGSRAGSIIAGPTIKTTKDMPIVEPPSFRALGLTQFQISPHYLDPDPRSTHMGETQEERILQFLEENEAPVVGLREGSMLRLHGNSVVLKGPFAARIFRRGEPPVECPANSELSNYLEPVALEGLER